MILIKMTVHIIKKSTISYNTKDWLLIKYRTGLEYYGLDGIVHEYKYRSWVRLLSPLTFRREIVLHSTGISTNAGCDIGYEKL